MVYLININISHAGFTILSALVTDLTPDVRVRNGKHFKT